MQGWGVGERHHLPYGKTSFLNAVPGSARINKHTRAHTNTWAHHMGTPARDTFEMHSLLHTHTRAHTHTKCVHTHHDILKSILLTIPVVVIHSIPPVCACVWVGVCVCLQVCPTNGSHTRARAHAGTHSTHAREDLLTSCCHRHFSWRRRVPRTRLQGLTWVRVWSDGPEQ